MQKYLLGNKFAQKELHCMLNIKAKKEEEKRMKPYRTWEKTLNWRLSNAGHENV